MSRWGKKGLWWSALLLFLAALGLVRAGLDHPQSDEIAPDGSPWHSPADCERALSGPARGAALRVASWNIAWFPDRHGDNGAGERGTDVAWLACLIAQMDVAVLAVQEIQQHARGRAALSELLRMLDQRTGGRWRAELDDCPREGRQHLGLLYDTARARVTDIRVLPSLNPGFDACDWRLRPGFGARVSLAGGPDLHLITLHLDSGISARDYHNRRRSWRRLEALLPRLTEVAADSDVLVLGDFNTMGCARCSPPVSAADELGALDEQLGSLERLSSSPPCTQYYDGEPGVLDHALASPALVDRIAVPVRVQGVCEQLACEPLTGGAPPALRRISDHCPVIVELQREGR